MQIPHPAFKWKVASRLWNYYGLNSEFTLPDLYHALDSFDKVFYEKYTAIGKVGWEAGRPWSKKKRI